MMDLIKLESFKEEKFVEVAEGIFKDVSEGESNPLFAYVQAKALEQLAKEVINRVKDLATDEASNYGKQDSVFNGASFSISQSGTLLNYSDDQEYKELEKQLKARQSKLKKAFDMHKEGEILVDAKTGEAVPVVGIKKHGESMIKVSFK